MGLTLLKMEDETIAALLMLPHLQDPRESAESKQVPVIIYKACIEYVLLII